MRQDDEEFVLEFIKRRQKVAPDWKPEESFVGDGKKSFADYWNEEPRNYKKLAELIRKHIERAR